MYTQTVIKNTYGEQLSTVISTDSVTARLIFKQQLGDVFSPRGAGPRFLECSAQTPLLLVPISRHEPAPDVIGLFCAGVTCGATIAHPASVPTLYTAPITCRGCIEGVYGPGSTLVPEIWEITGPLIMFFSPRYLPPISRLASARPFRSFII